MGTLNYPRAISYQSKGVANLSRLLNCNSPKWRDAANAVVQRIEVERRREPPFRAHSPLSSPVAVVGCRMAFCSAVKQYKIREGGRCEGSSSMQTLRCSGGSAPNMQAKRDPTWAKSRRNKPNDRMKYELFLSDDLDMQE